MYTLFQYRKQNSIFCTPRHERHSQRTNYNVDENKKGPRQRLVFNQWFVWLKFKRKFKFVNLNCKLQLLLCRTFDIIYNVAKLSPRLNGLHVDIIISFIWCHCQHACSNSSLVGVGIVVWTWPLARPSLAHIEIPHQHKCAKMHKFWRCRLIFWWNQHQNFEIVLFESGNVGLTVDHALGRRPAGVPVDVTLHVLHLLQSWKTKIRSIHGQVMGHYLAHRWSNTKHTKEAGTPNHDAATEWSPLSWVSSFHGKIMSTLKNAHTNE